MTSAIFGRKTEAELQREIEELQLQQRELDERLRESRIVRRIPRVHAGPPTGAYGNQSMPLSEGRGLGFMQRLARKAEDATEDAQPPAKKRLLSAVVKVGQEKEEEEEGQLIAEAQDLTMGDATQSSRDFPTVEVAVREIAPPRTAALQQDSRMVRRNRRMFGALLLGTLEKFREEDKKLQGSEAFVRRSDTLKRAEQRAQEASQQLREQQRNAMHERRCRDLELKARLVAKAEEKQLEVLLLRWSSHQERLATFLRTKAQPAIYYIPAKPSEEAEQRLAEQQKELEEWRKMRSEEVEEFRRTLAEEATRGIGSGNAGPHPSNQDHGHEGESGAMEDTAPPNAPEAMATDPAGNGLDLPAVEEMNDAKTHAEGEHIEDTNSEEQPAGIADAVLQDVVGYQSEDEPQV